MGQSRMGGVYTLITFNPIGLMSSVSGTRLCEGPGPCPAPRQIFPITLSKTPFPAFLTLEKRMLRRDIKSGVYLTCQPENQK